jgi:glycine cleavage system H protein
MGSKDGRMPEPLRISIDKFTFLVAADRLYAAEGVWVQPLGGGRVRLGASDYMQQHNGDVAFVDLKPAGTVLRRHEPVAEIETMKVTIEVVSPVSGTVVLVNQALANAPELVNQDPYGEGWLAEIETTDWEADRARLLEPQAYLVAMRAEAEQELKA